MLRRDKILKHEINLAHFCFLTDNEIVDVLT